MESAATCFDEELANLDASIRTGDTEMARLYLASFDLRLSGYVRSEERVVFSALEQATGGLCGPTAKLRKEHQRLRSLVTTLWEALATADRKRGLCVLASLRSVLALHVTKEDWVLYPLLERTTRTM